MRAATPGEQTCSARFRVRQLRVVVIVRPGTAGPVTLLINYHVAVVFLDGERAL